MKDNFFDAIVVGAGHAGSEAAHALAKLGSKTLLLALNLDSIAFLACNPSIGGTAKGHLVCEIDALGGIMGQISDKATLQLRQLNEGKGPAVQSLRAQVDKVKYHSLMKSQLEQMPCLSIKQGEVKSILTKNKKVIGIKTTFNENFYANAVIVATGVYLSSTIIVGENVKKAGPAGFQRANFLTKSLEKLGFPIRRFKTGTPPRVDGKTIDFSKFEIQNGEDDIQTFSFLNQNKKPNNSTPCFLGYTTKETKEHVLNNIHRAPLFSGKIKGTGARYCPSIETKIVKFSDKERHQIFLEPESAQTKEIYLQGLSTSFPVDVQKKIVRSIPGMSQTEIMRYAYAIEYDCIDPTSLFPTLESKLISGLFFAGQINGTSGYEEAAAQGIVAGINAHNFVSGKEKLVLERSNSYIGVLIDDLVTKGTEEPYRMMTSRAEHRLWLRQDNADIRLTPIGRKVGLVDNKRFALFNKKMKECDEFEKLLEKTKILKTKKLDQLLKNSNQQESEKSLTLKELFQRGFLLEEIEQEFGKFDFPPSVKNHVAVEIKYAGYIAQQKQLIEKQKKFENMQIPGGFDFLQIKGLRIEAAEKLAKIKPLTVGQAARISGVNPSDVTVLLLHLKNL